MKQQGTEDFRTIWCSRYKTYMKLGECIGCDQDKNCEFRDKGAMRRVKHKSE